MRNTESLTESQVDLAFTRAAAKVLVEIDEVRSELCELGARIADLKARERNIRKAWNTECPWDLPLTSAEIETLSEYGGWGQTSPEEY